MSKESKKILIQIILGSILYGVALYLTNTYPLMEIADLGIYLLVYFTMGYGVIQALGEQVLKGRIFGEYVLVFIATMGAFLIRRYPEAVAVLLFFQIGKALEAFAVHNQKKSISELLDLRATLANKKVRGKVESVHPRTLKKRNIIVINPGEKIPVDCIVVSGNSSIDMKALTGETMPREVREGHKIVSGSMNISNRLEARVVREYADSTASKIFELAESVAENKAESENFITKFSMFYTPFVVLLAACISFVPYYVWNIRTLDEWVYRGLTFLMVAVPNAIVISIPLAFLGGLGAASKHGVIVKGSNHLENLAKVDTFVFDKTGTLTEGVFEVIDIFPQEGFDKEKLLEFAALAERKSTHPIALSLKEAYGQEIEATRITYVRELAGFGIRATIDGKKIYVGNGSLMEKQNIPYQEIDSLGTIVYVAVDGSFAGGILIADAIREDARYTIDVLHHRYQAITVMFTGDNEKEAKAVGRALNIDYVYANLLPFDKVERMEEYLIAQRDDEKIAFVGDGMNDAPVLVKADVGIAMGGLGSDAAIEAADIVLLKDEPSKIISGIKIGQETLRVIRQNVWISMIIKTMVLLMAVLGWITMWEAVFVDMLVLIISIANAAWVIYYTE